jgi:hypothetical protein
MARMAPNVYTALSCAGALMDQTIVVTIPHRHGTEEALRRIKTAIDEARTKQAAKFKVAEEKWDGGHLDFRVAVLGQSIPGKIDVTDDHVRAEVLLNWLMAHLVKSTETLLKDEGQRVLG